MVSPTPSVSTIDGETVGSDVAGPSGPVSVAGPSRPVSAPPASSTQTPRANKRKLVPLPPPGRSETLKEVATALRFISDKRCKSSLDQYDHFGSTIASQLREIPSERARSLAMMDIQKIIFDAQFCDASSQVPRNVDISNINPSQSNAQHEGINYPANPAQEFSMTDYHEFL